MKVRNGGDKEIPLVQGKEQWLCFAGAAVKRYPTLKLRETQVRSSIKSTKTRMGAECGSDHELLISIFRLKLKKVGKDTGPFRFDLNQVRNRFKGLDLIDRVPEELWTEVHDTA